MKNAAAATQPASWLSVCIFSQVILAVYYQVIEWVPLFPWNDLSPSHGKNTQATVDIVVGIILLLLIAGAVKRLRLVMAAGVAVYGLWLCLQVVSWWQPYLWGASDQWAKTYQVWFSRTVRFLPPIDGHPIPDAAHVTMQIMIAVAMVSSAVAFLKCARSTPD